MRSDLRGGLLAVSLFAAAAHPAWAVRNVGAARATSPGGAPATAEMQRAIEGLEKRFPDLFDGSSAGGSMLPLEHGDSEGPLSYEYRDPACGEISLDVSLLAFGVAEMDGNPSVREIVVLVREVPGAGGSGLPAECRERLKEGYAVYVFAAPDTSSEGKLFVRLRLPDGMTASPVDGNNPVLLTDLDGNGREEVWISAYRPDGERWRTYSLFGLEMTGQSLEARYEFSARSGGQDSILSMQGETLTFKSGYRYWASKRFVEVGSVEVRGRVGGVDTVLQGFTQR